MRASPFEHSLANTMCRYAIKPDNTTKAAKARGSNLRVHFKVRINLFVNKVQISASTNRVLILSSYQDQRVIMKGIAKIEEFKGGFKVD